MSVSERQKAAIGRRRNEVETPALILDLDAARANIATMAEKVAALPAALRPHAKLHKSPQIAQMQVDAGAIGIATATIWEAIAMANAGIDDILIANEVVGPDKVARPRGGRALDAHHGRGRLAGQPRPAVGGCERRRQHRSA